MVKLNSLCVGDFFGPAFAVHVTGTTKLFLVIASETMLLYLKTHVSTNSLKCRWRTSSIELRKALSFSLYAMSVPTLIIIESSKSGLIQLSNYSRVILISFILVGTAEYFALDLVKMYGNLGPCDLPPALYLIACTIHEMIEFRVMWWVNSANLQCARIATIIIVLIKNEKPFYHRHQNFVTKFEIAFSCGSNEC